jgi:hypothetical protein
MGKIKVKVMQDMDTHWYWIPVDQVDDFASMLCSIEGNALGYDEDPMAYDDFEEAFSVYRTKGAPDVRPGVFENMDVTFIIGDQDNE